jgi:glycosyltransferase involved in cell wall biosynthesis
MVQLQWRNIQGARSILLIIVYGLFGSIRLFSALEPDPFNKTDEQKMEFESLIATDKQNSLVWQLRDYNPKTQLHIVVIVPSYNNSRWYKKNLDAIFMQNYKNYHIIYIDDASTDNTGALVEQYVRDRHQEHCVTVIKNQQRVYSLANIYKAVHVCSDNDIIATCDGDDWYCDQDVLSTLNKIYQYSDTWLTYGREIMLPNKHIINNKVNSQVIATNSFRTSTWNYSGMRTFYAWLFKRIKKEDLLYQEKFIQSHCDGAYFIPLLEMAGHRQQFISDIFYVANRATGINNYAANHDLQKKMAAYIRSKQRYQPIDPS